MAFAKQLHCDNLTCGMLLIWCFFHLHHRLNWAGSKSRCQIPLQAQGPVSSVSQGLPVLLNLPVSITKTAAEP
jgi:hypothetical protein